MDLNELAISTIRSEYIRKYLTDKKHKFTVEEQVALIIHSDISIEEKEKLFKMYEQTENISEYTCKDKKRFLRNIETLLVEISAITNVVNGYSNSVLVCNCDDKTYCTNKLERLIDKVEDLSEYVININSLNTCESIGYIKINADNSIIDYSIVDYENNELKKQYVHIPNELHIGSVIKTVYGDEELIIVSNTDAASNIDCKLTYEDSSVVAIPKELLDSTKDYKQQIEKIYIDRINNIENPCAKQDIIMENYVTVYLTDLTL
jgi:anion-transporting  ArsA/GET3 family ATPase